MRRWVQLAWWSAGMAVVAALGLWAALVFAPPSRAHLVNLVQAGDPTIDVVRAGCIVDMMRQSLTAARTEQLLAGGGEHPSASEQDVIVTAAVTCSGAGDANQRAATETGG